MEKSPKQQAAETVYYKILRQYEKAKRAKTKARLLEQLNASYSDTLPSYRQNMEAAQRLRVKSSHRPDTPVADKVPTAWPYIQGATQSALDGLAKGDPEPFFAALPYWPEILTDKDVVAHSIGKWVTEKLTNE
jgi:hypothetical protein